MSGWGPDLACNSHLHGYNGSVHVHDRSGSTPSKAGLFGVLSVLQSRNAALGGASPAPADSSCCVQRLHATRPVLCSHASYIVCASTQATCAKCPVVERVVDWSWCIAQMAWMSGSHLTVQTLPCVTMRGRRPQQQHWAWLRPHPAPQLLTLSHGEPPLLSAAYLGFRVTLKLNPKP